MKGSILPKKEIRSAIQVTASKTPGMKESRMAVLVIIAAGVLMRQYRINLTVVALHPKSHQSSQQPILMSI